MNYVDRTKVEIQMLKKGYTKKGLANEMGITYQALYSKLRGIHDFSETEICLLHKILGKDIFSC